MMKFALRLTFTFRVPTGGLRVEDLQGN